MAERPPIQGIGLVLGEREPDRLYEIEMPNGHRALAVVPLEGPRPSKPISDLLSTRVAVIFSAYDMSRCRISRWLTD